jgi:hypothetical protein
MVVSRARCGILHAAPQNRDRRRLGAWYGPGSAAHQAAKGGPLRCVRGTTASYDAGENDSARAMAQASLKRTSSVPSSSSPDRSEG